MKVILAKFSTRGTKYLSPALPSTGKRTVVTTWDKRHDDKTNRKLVTGVEACVDEIKTYVLLPPDYVLEEMVETVTKPTEKIEVKETPKMTDEMPSPVPVPPTAPASASKSTKEMRSDIRKAIKDIRDARKTISDETIAVKEQLKTMKVRAERKPLVEKIHANVAKRKTMSDEIKKLVAEIKALKA